jgi:hypothetical protein
MDFFNIASLRILLIILLSSCIFSSTLVQDNGDRKSSFNFSAFLDGYYSYDFNNPPEKKRLPFLFNHTRSNQFTINLALVTGSFEIGRFRSNLGIQQGTYAQDNYSEEPKVLRWLNQANIGFAFNKSKTLWLDAGLMPSHIGFENAVSTKNLTLSRSLIAENSPYFLTGGKLGWQANPRLYFSIWATNGWQVIQRIEGNSQPSFGTQVNFKSSEELTFNWSTFIGNNYNDTNRRMRYFSNHYAIWNPARNWKIIAGVDLGWEQKMKNSPTLNFWVGGAIIVSFEINPNWKSSFRGEFYSDPQGVIALNQNMEGLKTSGLSVNFDRNMGKNLIFRIESRYLTSPNEQFLKESKSSSSNLFVLASLAISLD